MYAHKNTFGVQNRVSSAPRVARAFQTYRPRMIWVWVQGHRHHQAHHPRAPQPFLFLEGIPLVKGYLEARDTFGGIPLARDTFSRNTRVHVRQELEREREPGAPPLAVIT